MSFTGGLYGTTIPDDYDYGCFERDMDTCAALIVCMQAKGEYKGFADVILGLLSENAEIVNAFGRITTYMERNSPAGLWDGMEDVPMEVDNG